MLLPLLVGIAVRNNSAPSSILMTVELATIVGGMATTIGTSQDMAPLGMFDFAFPVPIVGSLGLLYLQLITPRFLPESKAPPSDMAPRVFSASLYINTDSKVCGAAFSECLDLTDN